MAPIPADPLCSRAGLSAPACGSLPLPTLLPEGIERVPGRFAISWRNRWLLEHCDVVVCYVTHSWGGAAKFVQLAKKRGKSVCNLAEADGDVLEIRR